MCETMPYNDAFAVPYLESTFPDCFPHRDRENWDATEIVSWAAVHMGADHPDANYELPHVLTHILNQLSAGRELSADEFVFVDVALNPELCPGYRDRFQFLSNDQRVAVGMALMEIGFATGLGEALPVMEWLHWGWCPNEPSLTQV